MQGTLTGVASSQSLADLLAADPAWTLKERLVLARRLAMAIETLHARDKTHRALSAESIAVDDSLEPQLGPPAAARSFGARDSDAEFCPPELALESGIVLPPEIEDAAAILRQRGVNVDPRRVDVYQFGVLLARILTGEPLLSYRYRTRAKAKVPRVARELLDRCLGEEPGPPLTNCRELIEVLDQVLQRCDDAPPLAETPANGMRGAVVTDTKPLDVPFDRLGHYRIIARIGRGGMGDVYKGFDASLDRYAAIKVLPASLARDENLVRRFHREATAAAKLAHPNVVPIYFTGEDAGHHFFAMQFIEGESLAHCLAGPEKMPVEKAVTVVEQCLAGLEAAHAQGLVHRDIKPGNILLDRRGGQAMLVDFGLVRHMDSSASMTVTGVVMGTAAYVAPEQARGQAVDGRSDIYSLGVTFYEMLAGRLPFAADSATAMLFQQVFEAPRPLTDVVDVPRPLVQIVARMMAKDPAERYETCAAVLADLKAYCSGTQLDAAATDAREHSSFWSNRLLERSSIAGAGFAAFFLCAMLLPRAWKPHVTSASQNSGASTVADNAGESQGGLLAPPAIGPFDAAGAKRLQAAWARHLGVPIEVANSIGMKLILIPPGEFEMGSPKELIAEELKSHAYDSFFKERLPGEQPRHRVRITRPFWLGATDVTQLEFMRVMGKNPSMFAGDAERPVEQVTWDAAVEFCRRLSAMPSERAAHRRYALPSEAQWEYACRAGSTGRWYFSAQPTAPSAESEEESLPQFAWFRNNADHHTQPVAQKQPNAWGLYDMHGNVWQWCQDWFDKDYYAMLATDDPTGPPQGDARVIRGGCWRLEAVRCRSANRAFRPPSNHDYDLGFRVFVAVDSSFALSPDAMKESAGRAIDPAGP